MGFRRERRTLYVVHVQKTVIGRDIRKEKGHAFAFFAAMSAAFDKVKNRRYGG